MPFKLLKYENFPGIRGGRKAVMESEKLKNEDDKWEDNFANAIELLKRFSLEICQ